MTWIHPARGLELGEEAITQTFAVLGRKGSGKTYAAGKLVECFLERGAQVVVLDPIGNWYGLRLDRTGKKPSGFDIPILGGSFGDVPLEPGTGRLVAGFLVDTGSSAVLDVSHFRKGQRKQFVSELAEELFHLKKRRKSPMHLVLEEAQVFAPQQAKGQEVMLGAIEDIVRLGRNVGIGVTLISQRPQSVNKEVLNQAEPLIVFQLSADHERKAVRAWMDHLGMEDREQLDELAALGTGDCFLWSPAWLRTFRKTRFLQKTSFDASATPVLGAEEDPTELAPVDLAALQAAMASSIERAKQEDPKALRRRIAELEREVARLGVEAGPEAERRITKRLVVAICAQHGKWRDAATRAMEASDEFQQRMDALIGSEWLEKYEESSRLVGAVPPSGRPERPAAPTRPPAMSGEVSAGAERALEVLVARYPARFSNSQWATLARRSVKSSSWSLHKSELQKAGLVEATADGTFAATELARDTAGVPEPVTAAEVQEHWIAAVGKQAGAMLRHLIAAYPAWVAREDLAAATGYSLTSSSFSGALTTLRKNELIVSENGCVAASSSLVTP